MAVLPAEEEFPYAIRAVSETFESNGSTSMASTCASCMSLMAAGVPLKAMVAGISCGLVTGDTDDDYIVLTDIRMPGMDAMELLEKCSELDFPPHFILLSGYGEFEYAREALSFGAVSFVLKPLDPEELTKELQKCKEKLEHIYRQKSSVKKMQKDQFLLEQLSGMVPSENQ